MVTNILETSRTALKVDKWGMRKGEEFAEEYREKHGYDDWLQRTNFADCFASMHEPRPQLAERPSDVNVAEWFEQLLQTDGYKAVHKTTRGRIGASMVAAEEIAKQLSNYVQSVEEGTADVMEPAASTNRAVDSVKKAVDEFDDAVKALSSGGIGGSGPDASEIDAKKAVAMFNRVREDKLLSAIMASAGRFRRVAASLQRRKVKHGVDDMVGLTRGDDVGKLSQGDLAALCIEELEILELYRLATNTASIREYRGIEPQGKGPIVIVVDESGSMNGDRIITAKGLALALGWVARQQNRWCAFVAFAGGSEGNCLAMPPGKWDEEQVIDWLAHFYGGGTNLDVPIRELPQVYWKDFLKQGMPRGKTDVIMITDAVVRCSESDAMQFNAWKAAEQVTTFGLVLNSQAGEFESICNYCNTVATLSVDSEPVTEMLSKV